MSPPATRKKSKKTKRTGKKSKKRHPLSRFALYWKIFSFLALMSLLVFSLLMTGYVIFFRTVEAADLPFEEYDIVYEDVAPQQSQKTTAQSTDEKDTALPRVAIIIDDMGFHKIVGRKLIDLELNLSFSFLPHAPFTHELEPIVYQKGNTILLHLPLEPRSNEWDPGPGALYLNDDPETRKKLFHADLQRVPHATGVNNHMGSRFTEDHDAMEELAQLLFEQELFFIDSFTTSSSAGMVSARKMNVPTSRRHIFLDNVQEKEAICRQLEKLVELARHQDHAIGIGHPYPETLIALSSCGIEVLQRASVVGVDEVVQ